VSYLYQFPSPKRFNAFLDALLGGWAAAGVTTIQAGAPLSLTGMNTRNIFGITNDRAQLAAGCAYDDLANSGSVHSKLDNYLNNSCILRGPAPANSPPGTLGPATWRVIGDDGLATAFGNSGVGVVFGPDQRNFDIALIKRTSVGRLRDGANIEFRAEFFNAFNTTQFSNPNTNVSAGSNFGLITATAVNPRIMQFALKLNF